MAGFGPWTRGLVGILGFSHGRHGRRLMWCLRGSLSTNSTAWVPSARAVWDCLYKDSQGLPAQPHKVEVNKSDTESGHVTSLCRQPRYSHVPISVFLLSVLILARDYLHLSEGLEKLKHQEKVCLPIFLPPYSAQNGEVFSPGSC